MKRNVINRILCTALTGLMIFSFTACGKTEAEGSKLTGSPLSMYDLLSDKPIDLMSNKSFDLYGNTNQGAFGGNTFDNLNLPGENDDPNGNISELWELYMGPNSSDTDNSDVIDPRYVKLFNFMLEQEAFADLSLEISKFKNMLYETYSDPDMFCATDTTKIQPGDNIISVVDVIVNTMLFVNDYNDFTAYLNSLYSEEPIEGYEYLTEEQKAAMSAEELDEWMANAKTGILNNNKRLQILLKGVLRNMDLFYTIDANSVCCKSIGIYNDNGIFRVNTETLRKAIESDKEIVYKLIVLNVIPGICDAIDRSIYDIESYAGKSADSTLSVQIFDFKKELGIED